MKSKKLFLFTVIVIIFSVAIYVILVHFYKQRCERRQYAEIKKIIDNKFMSDLVRPVSFSKGIEFLGWRIDKPDVERGGSFKIDYFWKMKEKPGEQIFAFVHFIKEGNIVFQNDHELLEDRLELSVEFPDKVLKESYNVRVPIAADIGEYSIRMGLWLPGEGNKRLRIKGTKDSSVEIGKINIVQNELLKGLKGKIVFDSDASGNREIYVMDADGRNIKRLTTTETDNGYPGWSPDGEKIVFSSDRTGNREVFIMEKDGSGQKRITNHPATDINPSWHPDGRRVVFVSDRDGTMNFYLINTDGTELVKITDFKSGVHDIPRLSPDGREIIFLSNLRGGWQVYKIGIDGGNLGMITSTHVGHCEGDWSHSGERIVFVSRPGSGNADIWVMDKDGGNEERITFHRGLDYNPRFSSDDKKIIFSSQRDGNWEIYITDAGGGNPFRLTDTGFNENWPDWRVENEI